MQPHTAADYANQLRQLMPRGLAWRNPPGSVGDRDIEGEAEELARIDARALYLVLKEFYAQTTRELLPEWEKEYGLPDMCRTLADTLEQRREDLLQKIRSLGGQSRQYLIDQAKALGIDITITEFRPFRVGMNCAGDRLNSREWWFVFLVTAPTKRIYRFRAGQNAVGDRLRFWEPNTVLECIINHLKPAHTYAMFGYVEEERLDHMVYVDVAGNVVVRDSISEYATDPVLAVGENGSVSINPFSEGNAKNVALSRSEDGEVTILPDLEIPDVL